MTSFLVSIILFLVGKGELASIIAVFFPLSRQPGSEKEPASIGWENYGSEVFKPIQNFQVFPEIFFAQAIPVSPALIVFFPKNNPKSPGKGVFLLFVF